MKATLYHDPSCSKSNAVFDLLTELGVHFKVVNYLEETPTKEEIICILAMLKISAEMLIRKNEIIFRQLYQGRLLNENEWIEAMITYPTLIERPIVVCGSKAAIGRPIDQILNLF